jgi:hypothetical protein
MSPGTGAGARGSWRGGVGARARGRAGGGQGGRGMRVTATFASTLLDASALYVRVRKISVLEIFAGMLRTKYRSAISFFVSPTSFVSTDGPTISVNNGAGGESAIRTAPQRLPSVVGVAREVGWIDAAVAAREAEIQRLERLVGDALYALQKAGLDGEAARLGGP